MDRQQWRRIEEVFDRAAELPLLERERFLAQLPAAEQELRAEVESLLRESDADGDLVDDIVGQALAQSALDGTSQRTYGPYRTCGRLGGGSHADVYLAERTDGEYTAQVAIKIAKRGFPTEELRRRFRQERQILASLSHPNIAGLLDGGTTEDGLPFLVMEYVDGEPVDEYCDRRQLSITERLGLLTAVCSAVEHAHRALTIHRDLKPSNILVMADGRPMLLDFGIAKLLERSPDEVPELATVEGLRFMTPAYASPEQLLGEPLTTSTDVYSLGVVLYRLLCGRHPYAIDRAEPKALYEAICESRPPVPSRAASGALDDKAQAVAEARSESSRGLRQRLRGDLDTIASTALRKQPARRFESVAALRQDIERYLLHRPIQARRETLGYRAAKMVRRHPYGVAVTAALLLAVSLGVLTTLQATVQARQERDRAQLSQAEAEQATELLVEVFQEANPETSLGQPTSVLELLERSNRLLDGVSPDQPLLRARIGNVMGRAYHAMGRYSTARELLSAVVADRSQALGEDHQRVADGRLDLARATLAEGALDEAVQTLQRSLEIYALLGPEADRGRASALNLLAEARLLQKDPAQAEQLCRQALRLRESQLGGEHLETLQSLNDLAEILFVQGRKEEAQTLFVRALTGRRRLLPEAHPQLVKTLSNLAVVQQSLGDLESAEATLHEVLEARQRLYGEDHPHVALAYNNLAHVLSARSQHQEALELLERALTLGRQLYEGDHFRLGDYLYGLGLVLTRQERFAEAEQRLLESLAMRRRTLAADDSKLAQSLAALAAVRRSQGQIQLAIKDSRQCREILSRRLSAEHAQQRCG